MPAPEKTQAAALIHSDQFQQAKSRMVEALIAASGKISGVRPALDDRGVREQYAKSIDDYNLLRGRNLFYPFIASGLGNGPLVELCDGSVKYDMITGIGVNFFGHTHPAFVEEMALGLGADIMQGNLQPGHEAQDLSALLLSKVGEKCRLKHAWLTTCGTMANEIALKIIRQKKAPATKVLAFEHCFSGRSTAMQEITDNPKYREGQPVYGEVHYLPFYSAKLGLEASVDQTLDRFRELTTRYPGKFAALMIELVQGEGGFNFAPREYYVRVFEEAKKQELAIWADEVQTFGRTGELFAYQKFGLEEYVDVVTAAKMLQAAVTLYTEEYNPKPGLVAGTFSGSTVQLRTARKTLEMLCQDGYLGEDGKIAKLNQLFMRELKNLSQTTCYGKIKQVRGIGGMIAFEPLDGTMDSVKSVLMKLYELGVMAFSCGHGPYLVRLLPPLGAMDSRHVDEVCALIEKALLGDEAKGSTK